ncbi:hypothetical protein [uncultured Hymenobacter sp.]|uniref:hypothetical protein n=1 Tax=uncultured Hymenobacter sp. TaxID=170016 RepID=UPI0035CBC162
MRSNWSANLQTAAPTGAGHPSAFGGRGRRLLAGAGLLAGLGLSLPAAAQDQARPLGLNTPSDEQSYQKEVVFGINFNTQGALIGGASVRSARVLDERWLRFWSLEGVMLKNSKEQREVTPNYGGTVVRGKVNYAFALRPSFGMQRILFRKAADSGVQVNGLLSAGPTLGLLLPYYISYDRTPGGQRPDPQYFQEEAFDPEIHSFESIVDRGSLFGGVGKTSIVPGAHLRGALSFEYGRYRDAVAGLETGFLLEAYTKHLTILKPEATSANVQLNKQFFPSVYLTLYFGHRS